MSGKNKNIDEIKLLMPDYLMGKLTPEEAGEVEAALSGSEELRHLSDEIGGAFELAKIVKHSEPGEQYWTNLLPRIHERIDEASAKSFSLGKLAAYWKYSIPAAAVIILALLYFTVFNKKEESIITNKENREIIQDTSKNIEQKDNKIVNEENKTDEKLTISNLSSGKHRYTGSDTEEHVENKGKKEKDENLTKETLTEIDNDNITDFEEVSVTSGGAGGIDDEMDRELNMLSDKQQKRLLEELIESNL